MTAGVVGKLTCRWRQVALLSRRPCGNLRRSDHRRPIQAIDEGQFRGGTPIPSARWPRFARREATGHTRTDCVGGRRNDLRGGCMELGGFCRRSAQCGRLPRIAALRASAGARRKCRCGPCPDRRRARGPHNALRKSAANSPARAISARWLERRFSLEVPSDRS